MASACELQLWGESEGQVRTAADAAIADIRRIEAKYSRYRPDSVTSAINRRAGGAPVPIDTETAALLDYADVCHRLSGGAFDLTSGVLRRAWDFRATSSRLPDPAALDELRALVDWSAVRRDATSIQLPRAGMEIDFGGIGKEYAADRGATCCAERGILHGLVNLGGDVRLIGAQPAGAPWQVGIRAPRAEGVASIVGLTAGALATSGDYERYVEIDGRRYCHLLDARSGWPVSTWASITVLAPLCVAAGSCATIAMLLGEHGIDFLRAQGMPFLAIANDGTAIDALAPDVRRSRCSVPEGSGHGEGAAAK